MAQWLGDVSIGEWFQAEGEPFEIVGIDAKSEIVLVQYFDGTLEEIDFEVWTELAARPVPPPEDYSGALDIERSDYGMDGDDAGPQRWDNPLDLLDTRD
jgi:hypothetical protein